MANNVDNSINLDIAMAEYAQTLEAMNQAIATLVRPSILSIEHLMRSQLPSLLAPNILGIDRLMRIQLPSLLAPSILGLESLNRSVIPPLGSVEVLRRQRTSSSLAASVSRQASFESLNFALKTRRGRVTAEVPAWSVGNGTEFGDSTYTRERSDALVYFDIAVTDRKLRQVCRKLVADGHYTLAVEQAFKYVNNMVKEKSGVTEKDGTDLMFSVFSDKSPVLMLNPLQSQSDKNEQEGYQHIFAGVMMGIRNPRAHQHEILDSPQDAVERLVIANHLLCVLDRSTLSGSE